MAQQTDNRISYIKKPMAENSFMSLFPAAVGLVLFGAGIALSIRNQGNTPLSGIAMCFSSLLFSCLGLFYGFRSFREKEKNYILARIGAVLSGVLIILWLVMILIGFGR